MSSDKTDTIRSSSSGTIGRAVSHVRGQRLTLDSSTHPQPDAFTNSEAFLAGVSSCGVTLIEVHARDTGVPTCVLDRRPTVNIKLKAVLARDPLPEVLLITNRCTEPRSLR